MVNKLRLQTNMLFCAYFSLYKHGTKQMFCFFNFKKNKECVLRVILLWQIFSFLRLYKSQEMFKFFGKEVENEKFFDKPTHYRVET